jgi:uncharacterized membrane protein YkvA (DUF1232 family)
MSLRISFEIDDADLQHFRLLMRQSRNTSAHKSPEDIVSAAQELLQKTSHTKASGFILERLQKLELMISMISDLDWRMPHAESKRVLNALAYFADPDDLIPDHIPGLGFLDDAIMIELVVRELRHEIEAYQDFRSYRADSHSNSGSAKQHRAGIKTRRAELHARIRRRRERGGEAKPQLLD